MAKLTLTDFKEENPLIIICGPTASGKTDLSYLFYDLIDSELISADSRQVYKYLDIGTAKPPKWELNNYNYHLIDFLEPDLDFSAGKFAQLANEKIRQIYLKNKIPIVVGGTGFYISALCDGLMKTNEDLTDNFFNYEKFSQVRNLSKEDLENLLSEIDPQTIINYPDKNPRRLMRSLEFYYKTGDRFSDFRPVKNINTKYSPIYFAINHTREILYNRINVRCNEMIDRGFINEVENILSMGFSKELNSLNTVGYKEIINYLDAKYTLNQSIVEMQKNTRRYAKRQLTWFRKNDKINWLESNILNNSTLENLIKNQII